MESLTKEYKVKAVFNTIAYSGVNYVDELNEQLSDTSFVLSKFSNISDLATYLRALDFMALPDALVIEVKSNISELLSFLLELRDNDLKRNIPVILLVLKGNRSLLLQTFGTMVYDIYFYPFIAGNILERIKLAYKMRMLASLVPPTEGNESVGFQRYSIPLFKRLFDVAVSSTALVFAMPVMLIIAMLIKLDSKGPIFYKSKRAGSGYKVFDFYKFRSMRDEADKELAALMGKHNQYAANDPNAAFIKIKDDPRVTKLGAFLRNSSLDELPQLINVLKGDMSLVGNRPLPLYEAVHLTSDEWAARFLGPAGITGLWQVSKRGRGEMSDRERRQLDNHYTTNFSFWMDLKILLHTVPALFQKENV